MYADDLYPYPYHRVVELLYDAFLLDSERPACSGCSSTLDAGFWTGPELDRCQLGGFLSCRLPRWRYVSSPVPRCSDLTTSSTTARLLLLSPGRASRWMLSRCEVRCLGAAARPRGYGTAPMQEASRWAATPTAKVSELSNTLHCCHCSELSYCIKGSHVLSGRARSET